MIKDHLHGHCSITFVLSSSFDFKFDHKKSLPRSITSKPAVSLTNSASCQGAQSPSKTESSMMTIGFKGFPSSYTILARILSFNKLNQPFAFSWFGRTLSRKETLICWSPPPPFGESLFKLALPAILVLNWWILVVAPFSLSRLIFIC